VPPATSVPTTPTTPTTPTIATSAHTVIEAVAFIRSIYDPYAGADVDTPVVGNCFFTTTRPCPGSPDRYATPDLKVKLQESARTENADPVACGQNVPGRVSYDPPVRSDASVAVVVHTFYSGSGDVPIEVVVDLNTLKLSDVACPGPAGKG